MDSSNDKVIDDVTYYAYDSEDTYYITADLNDYNQNDTLSCDIYYNYNEDSSSFNDNYNSEMTVTKYDSNYTGPLQETISYSAGDNQEIEVNQEILSLSAVQVEDEEGNNINTTLTSITIPDSVTTIDSSAFADCTGLTGLTIPSSVTFIYDEAFSGCSGLTSITFNGTTTQWNAISKGNNWYPSSDTKIICTDGEIYANPV